MAYDFIFCFPAFKLMVNHFCLELTFAAFKYSFKFAQLFRVVAQSGSAHVWGAWGRKFESCLPDFTKPETVM